jgi:putative PIN family toxin of toxin-antitoxin system
LRAVLDVNVLIAALLSPGGSPAQLLRVWQAGAFELLVSPQLLAELTRALSYPRIRRLIPAEDADAFVAWLRHSATLVLDPSDAPPWRSADPDDDYLMTLAAAERAVLVSGDRHLLAFADRLPILAPADFLRSL